MGTCRVMGAFFSSIPMKLRTADLATLDDTIASSLPSSVHSLAVAVSSPSEMAFKIEVDDQLDGGLSRPVTIDGKSDPLEDCA